MSSGSLFPTGLALTASLVPPFASLRFPFWKSLLSQVHTPSEASIVSRTKAKLPECPAKYLGLSNRSVISFSHTCTLLLTALLVGPSTHNSYLPSPRSFGSALPECVLQLQTPLPSVALALITVLVFVAQYFLCSGSHMSVMFKRISSHSRDKELFLLSLTMVHNNVFLMT